jgi:hypothetical protein
MSSFQFFCIATFFKIRYAENFLYFKICYTYCSKTIQLENEIFFACGPPLQRTNFFAPFSNFLQIRIIECSVRPSQQVKPLSGIALPVHCSTPPVSTHSYQQTFTSVLDKVFNQPTMYFFRGSCFKCSLCNIITNLEQADNLGLR